VLHEQIRHQGPRVKETGGKVYMRLAFSCILMAAVVISYYTPAPAQSTSRPTQAGAPSPSAKKGQQTPVPDKPSKRFQKIHTLPNSCLRTETDPSNSTITKLHFSPSHDAKGTLACPASSLVPSTNAAAIADPKALGSDADYELDAIAPDKIAIYSKTKPPATSRLTTLEHAIDDLAGVDFTYAEAISVPAGKAKEIASKVSSLNSGGITAAPLDDDGGSSILLKSKNEPNPAILADLKRRIFDLRWQTPVASPTQRLFHLDATAVVKDFSGSANGSGDKPAADKSPTSKGTSDDGTQSATSTASPTVSVTVTTPGAAAPPDPTKAADSAGASSSDAAKPSDGAAAPPTKKAGATDAKGSDSAPKPLNMQAVNDTLVYSNSDSTDRGIFERNRLMAVLDLPRPEVLLNMWSLQASSRDYKVTNAEAEAVHGAVAQHNQLLQDAIDNGWAYLSSQMNPAQSSRFFNTQFYNYITQKFVLGESPDPVQEPSDYPAVEGNRTNWGWCRIGTYCLGFTHAFEPLRPTFTNILMAMIAANDPPEVVRQTIARMEGTCLSASGLPSDSCPKDQPQPPSLDDDSKSQVDEFRECLKQRTTEIQIARAEGAVDDCELADRLKMVEQVRSLGSDKPQGEHLQLSCFSKQALTSFKEDGGNQTTRVGLLRAAVADFLFNYKWATQYPHSFVPYDLSQSAQELNAELNPLILAFNRDVAAFTQGVQTEMECKYHSIKNNSWFHSGDETFLNDGMIAVRGISGVESIVDTVTQSFFNATKPPSLTDLVKSVSDSEKNLPGVLKTNLSANEAAVLLGALNSVKPAEAKIGRQLKLDIIPHALAGASSAELDVKLTAGESGNPTFFTADKSSEDNLSRVATHNTTTKVRVESLKLFEVSAFSAMLQRPRSKFPVLPPLFEVPYFGSFISFPVPGAKVYHRSTAIVSAVIVPTAADLAYGIDFTADRVCERASADYGVESRSRPSDPHHYVCHHASWPSDFNGLPLRNYHKAIVQCLATQQRTAHTGLLALSQKPEEETNESARTLARNALTERSIACENLSFSTVPPNE
jgi:hypothetical protein